MFERLFSLDHRRRKQLKTLPPGPLRDFYQTPFPAPKSDHNKVQYAAMDLETTGLDPRKDEIISIGLVCLAHGSITLQTARHWLVKPSQLIPESSAVIHALTDDQVAQGQPIAEVMAELLPLLAGKVLIAHHARVELQFLNRVCENIYQGKFIMPVIDTQWIAKRRLDRSNRVYPAGALRLAALREHYNLPHYRAHNALNDALGAAELFLAQLAERGSQQALPLKELLYKA